MYTPAPFLEEDLPTLHDLMRRDSFAALVTSSDGVPTASHLPFLLDPERGPFGTLRAHMARANPQWQHFADGADALVIFQGPHAYISPSWYVNQPNVPTWNYAVVHAYGTPRLLDEIKTYETLRDSVAEYESARPQPWAFDSVTEEYVQKMMRAIVAFEIEISRLEGKAKMSQNKPDADREGAIAGLLALDDPLAHETATRMRKTGKT